LLSRYGKSLRQGLDPDLSAVRPDKSDLASSDAVIDPGLGVARRRSYL
jgi:hypothetical protein